MPKIKQRPPAARPPTVKHVHFADKVHVQGGGGGEDGHGGAAKGDGGNSFLASLLADAATAQRRQTSGSGEEEEEEDEKGEVDGGGGGGGGGNNLFSSGTTGSNDKKKKNEGRTGSRGGGGGSGGVVGGVDLADLLRRVTGDAEGGAAGSGGDGDGKAKYDRADRRKGDLHGGERHLDGKRVSEAAMAAVAEQDDDDDDDGDDSVESDDDGEDADADVGPDLDDDRDQRGADNPYDADDEDGRLGGGGGGGGNTAAELAADTAAAARAAAAAVGSRGRRGGGTGTGGGARGGRRKLFSRRKRWPSLYHKFLARSCRQLGLPADGQRPIRMFLRPGEQQLPFAEVNRWRAGELWDARLAATSYLAALEDEQIRHARLVKKRRPNPLATWIDLDDDLDTEIRLSRALTAGAPLPPPPLPAVAATAGTALSAAAATAALPPGRTAQLNGDGDLWRSAADPVGAVTAGGWCWPYGSTAMRLRNSSQPRDVDGCVEASLQYGFCIRRHQQQQQQQEEEGRPPVRVRKVDELLAAPDPECDDGVDPADDIRLEPAMTAFFDEYFWEHVRTVRKQYDYIVRDGPGPSDPTRAGGAQMGAPQQLTRRQQRLFAHREYTLRCAHPGCGALKLIHLPATVPRHLTPEQLAASGLRVWVVRPTGRRGGEHTHAAPGGGGVLWQSGRPLCELHRLVPPGIPDDVPLAASLPLPLPALKCPELGAPPQQQEQFASAAGGGGGGGGDPSATAAAAGTSSCLLPPSQRAAAAMWLLEPPPPPVWTCRGLVWRRARQRGGSCCLVRCGATNPAATSPSSAADTAAVSALRGHPPSSSSSSSSSWCAACGARRPDGPRGWLRQLVEAALDSLGPSSATLRQVVGRREVAADAYVVLMQRAARALLETHLPPLPYQPPPPPSAASCTAAVAEATGDPAAAPSASGPLMAAVISSGAWAWPGLNMLKLYGGGGGAAAAVAGGGGGDGGSFIRRLPKKIMFAGRCLLPPPDAAAMVMAEGEYRNLQRAAGVWGVAGGSGGGGGGNGPRVWDVEQLGDWHMPLAFRHLQRAAAAVASAHLAVPADPPELAAAAPPGDPVAAIAVAAAAKQASAPPSRAAAAAAAVSHMLMGLMGSLEWPIDLRDPQAPKHPGTAALLGDPYARPAGGGCQQDNAPSAAVHVPAHGALGVQGPVPPPAATRRVVFGDGDLYIEGDAGGGGGGGGGGGQLPPSGSGPGSGSGTGAGAGAGAQAVAAATAAAAAVPRPESESGSRGAKEVIQILHGELQRSCPAIAALVAPLGASRAAADTAATAGGSGGGAAATAAGGKEGGSLAWDGPAGLRPTLELCGPAVRLHDTDADGVQDHPICMPYMVSELGKRRRLSPHVVLPVKSLLEERLQAAPPPPVAGVGVGVGAGDKVYNLGSREWFLHCLRQQLHPECEIFGGPVGQSAGLQLHATGRLHWLPAAAQQQVVAEAAAAAAAALQTQSSTEDLASALHDAVRSALHRRRNASAVHAPAGGSGEGSAGISPVGAGALDAAAAAQLDLLSPTLIVRPADPRIAAAAVAAGTGLGTAAAAAALAAPAMPAAAAMYGAAIPLSRAAAALPALRPAFHHRPLPRSTISQVVQFSIAAESRRLAAAAAATTAAPRTASNHQRQQQQRHPEWVLPGVPMGDPWDIAGVAAAQGFLGFSGAGGAAAASHGSSPAAAADDGRSGGILTRRMLRAATRASSAAAAPATVSGRRNRAAAAGGRMGAYAWRLWVSEGLGPIFGGGGGAAATRNRSEPSDREGRSSKKRKSSGHSDNDGDGEVGVVAAAGTGAAAAALTTDGDGSRTAAEVSLPPRVAMLMETARKSAIREDVVARAAARFAALMRGGAAAAAAAAAKSNGVQGQGASGAVSKDWRHSAATGGGGAYG
ncbi:hypothetical protein VOLCADRAFT_105645 [Volvox carteri f. nagariensis]|uniref:Uncharacterized protein n=1 Tax=Volvox carteri f. nagariensis TaxID=3068 RepID=D8U223_VOLCA|nr:uncharacterized protein VOLCADRAFT_105645 [Volvox carteri f. nagariensis]EFJ46207.1 hypothetical protein VOLCADRAFT_105645 [Volvox carteri f. nagariensis]|eukprot:XP_002952654.1 hypothetical protein VOLCADRAFT_105645 [Volvox carteri f. nagariensis]